MMAGLEQIAKGFTNKPAVDPGASTITPVGLQPNQSNQLAAELMNTLLQSKKKRGVTLTG
jgi:hypothetical protein